MLCHNELFKLRPHPRFLPSFYLMVAVGGAIGGIYVTLIAPYLFTTGFWELQWGLVACGALLVIFMLVESAATQPKPAAAQRKPAPGHRKGPRKARQQDTQRRRSFKPVIVASAAGVALLSVYNVSGAQSISPNRVLAARSFFGVVRVWELNADQPENRAYLLSHGRTGHGFQFDANDRRDVPTTYYTENSGVGLSILNHPARPGPLRIGGLGLGIGIIASYGQPGDVFRFYELDPDIIRLAEGKGGYFSFLSDSKAKVDVVPGDARISLERELTNEGSQNFDLLVLDAFSSDAVPLHLLTKEAFEVYLKHLQPGGIIAVNVSNRYFKLDQAVYRVADALNLDTALIQDRGTGVSYDSIWMLLARNRDFLELPAIADRSEERPSIPPGLQVWTDDYSNLLQILN
jgi:hypothetical protein